LSIRYANINIIARGKVEDTSAKEYKIEEIIWIIPLFERVDLINHRKGEL